MHRVLSAPPREVKASWFWRFFGPGLVLALSTTVLVIVIDRHHAIY